MVYDDVLRFHKENMFDFKAERIEKPPFKKLKILKILKKNCVTFKWSLGTVYIVVKIIG
jgi:hypothetical protein